MERKLRVISFFLAFVCVLAVPTSAAQEYSVTDIHPSDCSVNDRIEIPGAGTSVLKSSTDNSIVVPIGFPVHFECGNTQSPPFVNAPEFPTLAVPAGLLVGMIYIIFILRGKKNSSVQQK